MFHQKLLDVEHRILNIKHNKLIEKNKPIPISIPILDKLVVKE